MSTIVSHSLLARALAAVFKHKIGLVIHLAVRMPTTIAPIKALVHSMIVQRLLASISAIKSDSGMTMPINQSKPKLSR